MTDQTNADLIAEARKMDAGVKVTGYDETSWTFVKGPSIVSRLADALREVKAAAWDEGHRSGYIEGQADAHRLDPDDIEETSNPYADSPRHNEPQRREEQS